MTPREIIDSHPRARLACDRVAAVVRGGQPDRVPFYDNYWEQFAERYRRERGLPADASMAERFDHDYVLLDPVMGPWPSEARELERTSNGDVTARDEYGLVIRFNEARQGVPQQLDSRIRAKADLDTNFFEDPADPTRTAGLARDLATACTRFCPVLKLGGPFSRTWRLRGLARFLEDIAEDPAFVKEMTARMTDHLVAVGEAAADRLAWPPIQLHIADDFASTSSPLLSPRSYEEIFLPNLAKMVAAFHARGYRVSYESEGNVQPMLGLIEASGVDGLAHMEPRAGMRIERIRATFGRRFFFMGTACNTRVLPSGDRGVIAREVHRVLSACRDGRCMGLSAHSVGTDISSDAYDYYHGLMAEFGRYPLRLEGLEQEIRRVS